MEIDYGRLGPDVILMSADVCCNLGIALQTNGQLDESIKVLLEGWDCKTNADQASLLFNAFKVANCVH